MINVDCSGLTCPAPLIRIKKALASGESVVALIDNETSFQNVSRFLTDNGYAFTWQREANRFTLNISQPSETGIIHPTPQPTPQPVESSVNALGNVVVISSDCMGRGDDELGRILIKGFLSTLPEISPLPTEIIFYNSGVRLTAEGSASVGVLSELAARGVKVTVCGTCADFFHMKEKIAVGEISNMYAISKSLAEATKIIKPC